MESEASEVSLDLLPSDFAPYGEKVHAKKQNPRPLPYQK